MTGAFVSRRRADEFDALLSAPAPEREAAQYADLLELVGSMRSLPPVAARAEFVSDLRSQLMVEAARQARPAVDDATRLRLTPKQRQGARERRLATVLGGFAIVAASGSMAMASQGALPGDVLYPVKRAIENAETNLQADDAAKAQALLDHAAQRLQEAEQLTAQGADAAIVAETLQDFSDQSQQATELALDDYAATGDRDAIADLRTFTSQSMTELTALGDVVPSDARAALITAAQTVANADSAAFQACPTCGDGAVTELPGFATAPISLPYTLVTGERTPQSVVVPPDFLAQVENIAKNEPDVPPTTGDEPRSDDGSVTDPDTEPVTDPVTEPITEPDDEPDNPLEEFGDKIKRGLEAAGNGHGDEAVNETIDGVVGGVDGLVDGILGN
ncbi:DUF5667 domain-containing protein [Nocardioides pelophilus]|uniref:DUF5667 domain-containing protein n=1 Tax=Nocardioides pelophilus TaxID=2172019 RepID=UPI0015FF4FC1|nr:DUF5667 domain-containing protein [Nocardioides pelophilus]